MAALKYLYAYLGFAKQATYSGEVWSLGPPVVADGVAVPASIVGKDGCSPALRRRRSERRKREGSYKGKYKRESQQIHWLGDPVGWAGSGAKSLCVCQGTLSDAISLCLRKNSRA